MKLADVKYILPRMKYSTHTPKTRPIPEGYYMRYSSIKDVVDSNNDNNFCTKIYKYLKNLF